MQRGVLLSEAADVVELNEVVEVIDDDLNAFLQVQALSETTDSIVETQTLSPTKEPINQLATDTSASSLNEYFKARDAAVLEAEAIDAMQLKAKQEVILEAREHKILQDRHLIDLENVKAFISINRNLEIPPAPPVVPTAAPSKQAAKYVAKRSRAVLTID